ncbi:MAG: hypothetical protein ACXVNF_09550 [Neobacillus sp.]
MFNMKIRVNGKLMSDLAAQEQRKFDTVNALKVALPASIVVGVGMYAVDALTAVKTKSAFLQYSELSPTFTDKLVDVIEVVTDFII